MLNAITCTDDLDITFIEHTPLLVCSVIMPDPSFEHKGHDLKTFVWMQADRTIDECLGSGPIEQVGKRSYMASVLRKPDRFILNNLSPVEGA
jgi:hypothetical protein